MSTTIGRRQNCTRFVVTGLVATIVKEYCKEEAKMIRAYIEKRSYERLTKQLDQEIMSYIPNYYETWFRKTFNMFIQNRN